MKFINKKLWLFIFVIILSVFSIVGCQQSTKSDNMKTQSEGIEEQSQQPCIVFDGEGIGEEKRISLDELKNMKDGFVEDDYFALNSYGTKEYFHFKGISIWYLLSEKMKLNEHAKTVTFVADDGYIISYSLDEVKKEDYIDEQNPDKKYKMIIAWEENGKAYDEKEGSPFRLVVGQKEAGDVNKPNWVQFLMTVNVD